MIQTYKALRWSDTRFCYRLAKDMVVRAASLDTSPPDPIGHLFWMKRWIRDEHRIAWTIRYHGIRVGLIRYDLLTKAIGIAISEEWRGKGFALEALLDCTPYFAKKGDVVYATIKPENTASLDLFAKAGYQVDALSPQPNIRMIWRPE